MAMGAPDVEDMAPLLVIVLAVMVCVPFLWPFLAWMIWSLYKEDRDARRRKMAPDLVRTLQKKGIPTPPCGEIVGYDAVVQDWSRLSRLASNNR